MINMQSEAFDDIPTTEVANILRALADLIDGHPHFGPGHSQPLQDRFNDEVGWVDVKE
jgi:hypothetical protein